MVRYRDRDNDIKIKNTEIYNTDEHRDIHRKDIEIGTDIERHKADVEN